ncbi:IclR family transcriptional regulator [Candidatus Aerophobetes bacterium]|nr:IclR family transcriptional regulator [Candidatus Aerophobetes bacterium]
MKKPSTKRYKVHSLERGLDIIEVLSDGAAGKSLTEISRQAGFNLSTTHRILDALKSRGYVEQNPKTLKYRLTLKFFEIGNGVVRHLNLREEAVPILVSLAEKTGEAAYLIVLDNDEALCLERIDGHHYIQVLFLKVGGRMPLNIGAGPRVLLAHLPDKEIERIIKEKGLACWTKNSITDPEKLKEDLKKIREQGYALSFEDVTEGAAALGAPVKNWEGKVIAAISISGLSSHFAEEKLPPLIDAVKNAAEKLSQRLNAPLGNQGV